MMFLPTRGRRLIGVAAAFAALSVLAPAAKASFTYTVAPVTTSTNFGTASNMTVTAFNNGAPSPVLSGTQIINLAQITQTSTRTTGTDTGTIPVNLTVTINNQNGGGSGAFTVVGNINVTRSDVAGAASTFTLVSVLPPSITLGTFTYMLGTPQYAAPTIGAGGNGNGSLSMTITETVVPEPGSIALMGIGIAAIAGLALRRSLHRRAEQV